MSFQCSVATASASEGADAGQAAAEAAKRGALLARVMQRVGQPEGAAACLAAALARWASEGWDGMPLARALARLWLQGGQAETTGSDGQGLGVWAREVVGEGSWVTVARWLAWALLEESGVVAAQVLQQLEPIVGEWAATPPAVSTIHNNSLSLRMAKIMNCFARSNTRSCGLYLQWILIEYMIYIIFVLCIQFFLPQQKGQHESTQRLLYKCGYDMRREPSQHDHMQTTIGSGTA